MEVLVIVGIVNVGSSARIYFHHRDSHFLFMGSFDKQVFDERCHASAAGSYANETWLHFSKICKVDRM